VSALAPLPDVLREFARPVLAPLGARSAEAVEVAVAFAARVWDAVTTAQRAGDAREIERLRRELAADAPGLLEPARSLCERKVLWFSSDLRLTADLRLGDERPAPPELVVLPGYAAAARTRTA
jgi:hypothetical protein